MVVQPRADVLRCYRQHDHGLACGVAAAAWHEPPPEEVIYAIGHHDVGWVDEDVALRLDPEQGRPYDFMTLPLSDRLVIYRRGIDLLEQRGAYAGALGSLHFAGFVAGGAAPEFVADEERRRARLGVGDDDGVEHDFALLRALDLLSLVACLAEPGSDPAARPRWVSAPMRVDGVEYRLRWEGGDLVVDPSPFAEAFTMRVPYWDIPRRPYRSQDQLDRAWSEATAGTLEVRVRPVRAF